MKRLLYAIIDFDFAVVISPERKRCFRRPYHELCGTRSPIKDTHTGEFDFDPFIFDVGVMGALLCADFQVCDGYLIFAHRKFADLVPAFVATTTFAGTPSRQDDHLES